jgi:cytochrome c556
MKLMIATALAALTMAGAAMAQPSPEMAAAREAMMKACATDAKTLCSGKEGREQMMCMRENQDKASAGCKDAMSKMPRRGGGGAPAAPN